MLTQVVINAIYMLAKKEPFGQRVLNFFWISFYKY